MSKIHSAKYLTIFYFSFIAFALVAIHVSVYWQTTEGLEHIYGENRLDRVKSLVAADLAQSDLSDRSVLRVQDLNLEETDDGTEIVFDFSLLPDWFPDPVELEYDKGREVLSKTSDEAYFIMKTRLETGTGPREAMLVMDFRLYELTEAELLASHENQVVISLVLLVLSLFVVIKISDRLTQPVSFFARTLASKPSEDLSPVPLPTGTKTSELVGMVETFNRYLQRIETLVERERAFSRYASHEMRSPLTVMKGALTLMDESDSPAFQATQKKRLNDAVREMSELIETLLNLTHEPGDDETISRPLTEAEIQEIVIEHEYLLAEKPLTWRIVVTDDTQIRMPREALRILLGNLVKNAFTYAEKGEVLIEAFPGGLRVTDNGALHTDSKHLQEGFGLGLLLVRDICHRFGWHTNHESNDKGGWTTNVSF